MDISGLFLKLVFNIEMFSLNWRVKKFYLRFYTFPNTYLTFVTGESHRTDATITIDLIHAFSAIFAWVWRAIVDVCATITTWKEKNKLSLDKMIVSTNNTNFIHSWIIIIITANSGHLTKQEIFSETMPQLHLIKLTPKARRLFRV